MCRKREEKFRSTSKRSLSDGQKQTRALSVQPDKDDSFALRDSPIISEFLILQHDQNDAFISVIIFLRICSSNCTGRLVEIVLKMVRALREQDFKQ
jgi:hypothetical protein